jgi:hypothetical protein
MKAQAPRHDSPVFRHGPIDDHAHADLRWLSVAAWPSTMNDVCVVSYSFPDTKTLPNPVTGPDVTDEVIPVPPIPPPSLG